MLDDYVDDKYQEIDEICFHMQPVKRDFKDHPQLHINPVILYSIQCAGSRL